MTEGRAINALREKVAEALEAHSASTSQENCCSCGEWLGRPDLGPFEMQHRDHVAEFVLDALGLPALLAKVWEKGRASGHSRAMRYMSDEPHLDLTPANPYLDPVQALLEASSFGTPEAKALRESVSPEDAERVVRRSEELRVERGETHA